MTSKRISDKRSLYFQTIARDFFERRGAPFFLSAKELSQIEEWEKEGIPLRVVREGIANSFSSRRWRGGGRGKVFSLTFCAPSIQQAFSMYKERTVGKEQRKRNAEDKKKAVGKAVARFVKDIPPQVQWLEVAFLRVIDVLPVCSDEDLERMEEEIESLLFLKAGREDKEEAWRTVAREFPAAGKEEAGRLMRIKLIKLMRGKYRIPHIAPFHY
jgi:hypothetical protein